MSKPENPVAFPHVTQSKRAGSDTIYTHVSEGMSLRDWFAGQVLSGGLRGIPVDIEEAENVARRCYMTADAMLAARKAQG